MANSRQVRTTQISPGRAVYNVQLRVGQGVLGANSGRIKGGVFATSLRAFAVPRQGRATGPFNALSGCGRGRRYCSLSARCCTGESP